MLAVPGAHFELAVPVGIRPGCSRRHAGRSQRVPAAHPMPSWLLFQGGQWAARPEVVWVGAAQGHKAKSRGESRPVPIRH